MSGLSAMTLSDLLIGIAGFLCTMILAFAASELRHIREQLVKVSLQIELAVKDISNVQKINDDHEQRLRSLERINDEKNSR